jgi:hypothetical protein
MEITFKFSRGSKKEKELSPPIPEATPAATPILPPVAYITTPQVDSKNDYFNNFVANDNFVELFKCVPEIAFPIIYIISRIKNAEVVLRRYSDDAELWSDSSHKLFGIDKLVSDRVKLFLQKPNFFQDFWQFTEQYFLNRYLTGNSFIFANTVERLEKWRFCDNFFVLPTNNVTIERNLNKPFYTAKSIDELVKYYKINTNSGIMQVDPECMMFTRDLEFFENKNGSLKGISRLSTQRKPIENLIAVYEARNVIYTKRGAMGAVISNKRDADSTLPLQRAEKEAIKQEFYGQYGISGKRNPFAIIDTPVSFIPFPATIENLQPFRESDADAAQISGIFQIKKELLPREENSTFANQESAELSAYNDMVIPEFKLYLSKISEFLGLTTTASGYYLDGKFDKVSIIQRAQKTNAEMETLKFNNLMAQYNAGLITLNEVLISMGREPREDSRYKLTKIEMGLTTTNN